MTNDNQRDELDLARLSRAAVRAHRQTLSHPPSDEAAECELLEGALRDPVIRRWAEDRQAYGREARQHDPLGGAAVEGVVPLTVHPAWKRYRMISTHLQALVRTRCGVSGDRLVVLVQAVEFDPDSLPSLKDIDEDVRRTGGTCEHADARQERQNLERIRARPGMAEFAEARLPGAWRRERRAFAVLCRRSTCTEGAATRRTRARRRGAGSPARRRTRGRAPSGDGASEPEPAKRPAPADDDVVRQSQGTLA